MDRREVLSKQVGISDGDLNCGLRIKLMDEKGFLLIAVVVESWLDGGKDVVGFKADHIMEESSEFVSF